LGHGVLVDFCLKIQELINITISLKYLGRESQGKTVKFR